MKKDKVTKEVLRARVKAREQKEYEKGLHSLFKKGFVIIKCSDKDMALAMMDKKTGDYIDGVYVMNEIIDYDFLAMVLRGDITEECRREYESKLELRRETFAKMIIRIEEVQKILIRKP
jgi:hypothetical protein